MSFMVNNSDAGIYLLFFTGKPLAHNAMAAHVAQPVEHVLGKDGVTSSILVVGSR